MRISANAVISLRDLTGCIANFSGIFLIRALNLQFTISYLYLKCFLGWGGLSVLFLDLIEKFVPFVRDA